MTPPEDKLRKLIEVGLPLDDINAACKADKDRAHSTLRNIHKWFAPMPLPAWRALLFAALVDDPGDEERRLYLLDVIRRLVKNGADLPDEPDLHEAQLILKAQFPEGVPTVMDPFCGGGSTLVEAQRLGLPSYGSDLNPVPVLISRTLTETLPKVWGRQPLNPESLYVSKAHGGRGQGRSRHTSLFGETGETQTYVGYEGLIRDVIVYAEQIRDTVAAKTAAHFPLTTGETPVAWLWARTAPCHNPACRAETILVTSWWLSKKKGDLAWIVPTVDGTTITLEVMSNQPTGTAPREPKVGRGDFACLCCGTILKADDLRTAGKGGRLGIRMIAIAVERDGRRIYRAPRPDEIRAAETCPRPEGVGEFQLAGWARKNVPLYGLDTWADQYTNRQSAVLAAFADQIAATRSRVLTEGGSEDWADAVVATLGLMMGRLAHSHSTQSRWWLHERKDSVMQPGFARNDLPMTWDFAESYAFGLARGSWLPTVRKSLNGLRNLSPNATVGRISRTDARMASLAQGGLVATDPPYFDAIGYADLSDYFYVWHRRALRDVFPDLYTSMAAPKTGELTAIPSHHGGDVDKAKAYFIEGFTKAFSNLQQPSAVDGAGASVRRRLRVEGTERRRFGTVAVGVRTDLDDRVRFGNHWDLAHSRHRYQTHGRDGYKFGRHVHRYGRSPPADGVAADVMVGLRSRSKR
jgi:putative DNA methylase